MAPALGRRMACWLYEGLLLFAVAFIAGYLYSTLSQARHAMQHRTGLQFFLLLVFGIYFVWFWSKGQTLAMKTWHIQVVDHKLRPLTQRRALLRFLLSWIWFLPPLVGAYLLKTPPAISFGLTLGWIAFWAISSQFQSERQFWHDVWAGSKLISSRSFSSN